MRTDWIDGKPVPVYRQPYNKPDMINLIASAMTDEYDMQEGDPESWRGLSCLEVTAKRAAQKAARGDEKSRDFVFDRIIGKPKQTIEQMSVAMTFQDFIDQRLAELDKSSPYTLIAEQPVDVEDVSTSIDLSILHGF